MAPRKHSGPERKRHDQRSHQDIEAYRRLPRSSRRDRHTAPSLEPTSTRHDHCNCPRSSCWLSGQWPSARHDGPTRPAADVEEILSATAKFLEGPRNPRGRDQPYPSVHSQRPCSGEPSKCQLLAQLWLAGGQEPHCLQAQHLGLKLPKLLQPRLRAKRHWPPLTEPRRHCSPRQKILGCRRSAPQRTGRHLCMQARTTAGHQACCCKTGQTSPRRTRRFHGCRHHGRSSRGSTADLDSWGQRSPARTRSSPTRSDRQASRTSQGNPPAQQAPRPELTAWATPGSAPPPLRRHPHQRPQ
mmetsp:Transcript_20745/g.45596  ORF Transcript_20745/g.45596 Transcript_20745/m.45596 type:complete len:299 (-) Transcript_20745:310-1206(-)